MPSLKKKLRGLLLRLFNAIENNGNYNFNSNGESFFIEYLFKQFKSPAVIFDIGANVGDYSKIIESQSLKSEVDIRLHVFEPTRSCFEQLTEKFGGKNNVTLNNYGVSDSNGLATIFYDKESSGLASLYQRNLESYGLELSYIEEVRIRRMDAYIEEKNINHIDFIKIDIEGHELKAFEGFGSYLNGEFIDYIQFEYGGANLDSHTSLMDIFKFLTEKGFVLAKVMPNGLEVRGYSPFMDNFNYANYVAISNFKII